MAEKLTDKIRSYKVIDKIIEIERVRVHSNLFIAPRF